MPSAPAIGGNQATTDEDPLIEYPSGVVTPVQVEDVRVELATTPKVDQQTPNLGLVGSWSGISDFGHRMYTDEEENV
ncbi:hypothetical protein A2U01_0048736 [Trifolium medium]|uniref:Uncharacterized protein n=1 Tax=Trifolium medium TaxID=97028 RepID=A0A392QU61_9FABA|nr:hypothetical protein [Trifolium medium]